MKVSNATSPPDFIHAIKGVITKTLSIERHGNNKKPNPTSFMHPMCNVSAVNCKSKESRESQMHRRNVVRDDDSRKGALNWQEKVKISNKFSSYRGDFIKTLTEIQSMWDGDLGRIIVAKH